MSRMLQRMLSVMQLIGETISIRKMDKTDAS